MCVQGPSIIISGLSAPNGFWVTDLPCWHESQLLAWITGVAANLLVCQCFRICTWTMSFLGTSVWLCLYRMPSFTKNRFISSSVTVTPGSWLKQEVHFTCYNWVPGFLYNQWYPFPSGWCLLTHLWPTVLGFWRSHESQCLTCQGCLLQTSLWHHHSGLSCIWRRFGHPDVHKSLWGGFHQSKNFSQVQVCCPLTGKGLVVSIGHWAWWTAFLVRIYSWSHNSPGLPPPKVDFGSIALLS